MKSLISPSDTASASSEENENSGDRVPHLKWTGRESQPGEKGLQGREGKGLQGLPVQPQAAATSDENENSGDRVPYLK